MFPNDYGQLYEWPLKATSRAASNPIKTAYGYHWAEIYQIGG